MPKLKILIAEDEKVTQAKYKLGFPEKLCDVRLTLNGQEALDVYREWQPDIILMDCNMPVLNGYQALKIIREKDTETTVIMVTAMTDKENIIACAQFGIQGYIVKPFSTDEIASKVFQFHNTKRNTPQ